MLWVFNTDQSKLQHEKICSVIVVAVHPTILIQSKVLSRRTYTELRSFITIVSGISKAQETQYMNQMTATAKQLEKSGAHVPEKLSTAYKCRYVCLHLGLPLQPVTSPWRGNVLQHLLKAQLVPKPDLLSSIRADLRALNTLRFLVSLN